jgi:hypothetical protein
MPKEDLVGWIVKTESEASPAVVVDRLKQAAYDHNNSKRGRKKAFATLGDSIQHCPRKFYKTERADQKTLVQTKEPVLVLKTDGKL